jgi:hypothetical protein
MIEANRNPAATQKFHELGLRKDRFLAAICPNFADLIIASVA